MPNKTRVQPHFTDEEMEASNLGHMVSERKT